MVFRHLNPSPAPEQFITVQCPLGKRPLGGGAQVFGMIPGQPLPIIVSSMVDPGANGWSAKAGSNGNTSWGMDVSVVCAVVM